MVGSIFCRFTRPKFAHTNCTKDYYATLTPKLQAGKRFFFSIIEEIGMESAERLRKPRRPIDASSLSRVIDILFARDHVPCLVNLGVVSVFWPARRRNEAPGMLTHAVFVTSAAYRGFLKRKPTAAEHLKG